MPIEPVEDVSIQRGTCVSSSSDAPYAMTMPDGDAFSAPACAQYFPHTCSVEKSGTPNAIHMSAAFAPALSCPRDYF